MSEEPQDSINATPDAPKEKPRSHTYSLGEEIAHSITHGLGAVISVAALTVLIFLSASSGDGRKLGSAIVFGISMILLYTFSTLYHSFPWAGVKHVFKVLDHAGIYLLIAGSYTPFALVTLRHSGGTLLFGIVWTIAVIGIATEAFWVHRPKWLSVIVYVSMGWIAAFMIGPLSRALPPAALWLLVGGGLAYTVGAVAYIPRSVRYLHAVWHLFVLAGTICHFLAIALYVVR